VAHSAPMTHFTFNAWFESSVGDSIRTFENGLHFFNAMIKWIRIVDTDGWTQVQRVVLRGQLSRLPILTKYWGVVLRGRLSRLPILTKYWGHVTFSFIDFLFIALHIM
jgi:hypothetical protein